MNANELIEFINKVQKMYHTEAEIELRVLHKGKEIKCTLSNAQIKFDTKDDTIENFRIQLRGYTEEATV